MFSTQGNNAHLIDFRSISLHYICTMVKQGAIADQFIIFMLYKLQRHIGLYSGKYPNMRLGLNFKPYQ